MHNLVEISGQGSVPLIQLQSDVTLLKQHLADGNGFGVPLMRPKGCKGFLVYYKRCKNGWPKM